MFIYKHYIDFFDKNGHFSDFQADCGRGTNFQNHFFFFFFFITGLGAYLNIVSRRSEKKGQEEHPSIYIYIMLFLPLFFGSSADDVQICS